MPGKRRADWEGCLEVNSDFKGFFSKVYKNKLGVNHIFGILEIPVNIAEALK